MKVILSAVFDSEEDGVDGRVSLTRGDVDDLHSLAHVMADFARACGFSYVSDVGFEKDDGEMTFGGF